ncbi:MAG: ECF-type sigma factor [Phycisphaerales bacterium]|jgi:RNA polymerase sigma factor (TIGR02999 family)|nr:ECF-type sigma factor [Phycisphaerales bacterium]
MKDDQFEQMLLEIRSGDRSPHDGLFELVYADIRRLASACFRDERSNHTLTPTALVHEAWLRLTLPRQRPDWRDRRHFFNCAARVMRQILIDHARSRGCQRRGGGRIRIPIDADELAAKPEPGLMLALDRSITRLATTDLELGEIVRLRYYAGLSCEQAAGIMGMPLRTFKRRWSLARAHLALDIENSGPDFVGSAR